jgi:hypothetical protein
MSLLCTVIAKLLLAVLSFIMGPAAVEGVIAADRDDKRIQLTDWRDSPVWNC